MTHATIVGKFPPLQGGTAGQALWLAYRLLRQGIRVSVVTTGAIGGSAACSVVTPGDWSALKCAYPAFANLEVVPIDAEGGRAWSIPAGDGLATRLAATAIEVVEARRSEILIGVYLEPYGVAAYLASKATGVPFAVMHAGSDLARLAELRTRRSLYSVVMRDARLIMSTTLGGRRALALGADIEGLLTDRPALEPNSLYSPHGPKLDLARLGQAPNGQSATFVGAKFTDDDEGRLIFGIYGKHRPKKHFESAIRSVGEVAHTRHLMRMVIASDDADGELLRIAEEAGILDYICLFPYLPQWKTPQLIRACDVLFFLEQGFEIDTHRSQVPREIASTGRCLVISREAAENQRVTMPLVHMQNAVIVEDATNVPELAAALSGVLGDAEQRRAVAAAGGAAFPRPNDERADDWTKALVQELKGAQGSMLQYFQAESLKVFTKASSQEWWAGDAAPSDATDVLSRAEVRTLRLLAADPAVRRFRQELLKKKWGFMSRRFNDVMGQDAELRTAAKHRFDETWVFLDSPIHEQVGAFADMLRQLVADLRPSDLELTARLTLAEWTARVMLGNGVQADPQVETAGVPSRFPLGLRDVVALNSPTALVALPYDIISNPSVPAPVSVLIYMNDRSLEARYAHVSPAIARVLDRLDSVFTVADYVNGFERNVDRDVSEQALLSLERLVTMGAVLRLPESPKNV